MPNRLSDWPLGESRPNKMEYGWLVQAELGGQQWEFGCSVFVFPGSRKRRSSLKGLVKKGQVDFWEVGADGNRRRARFRKISAEARPGGVLVRVYEPAFLRAFKAERPSVVRFRQRGEQIAPLDLEVNVAYKD